MTAVVHVPAGLSVTGVTAGSRLTGGEVSVFKYSEEISAKTGIATYVALVDAAVDMAQFANKLNFVLTKDGALLPGV